MTIKKTPHCEARKGEFGPPCEHGQKNLYRVIVDGMVRLICGVHNNVYLRDPEKLFLVERVVQGEILAQTLEPGSATMPQLPAAVKVVGKRGVEKARQKIVRPPFGDFVVDSVKPIHPRELTGNEFYVVGTGSSSIHGQWKLMNAIKNHYVIPMLKRTADKHGDNLVVISGAAKGFDYILMAAALELGIRCWAVIPSAESDTECGYIKFYWGSRRDTVEIDRVNEKLADVELIVYVNKTYIGRDGVGGHANFDRNEAMLQLAAEGRGALWVYNKTSRGTSQTYHLAKKMGVSPIWEIPLIKVKSL